MIDPIGLERLLTIQSLLDETIATMQAQSRRRDEAVFGLADAGVSYSDIGRILGFTPERARQLTARHLGISVAERNPKPKMAVNRH